MKNSTVKTSKGKACNARSPGSLTEELNCLEKRLASLNIGTSTVDMVALAGNGSAMGEHSAILQNDIRISLKNVGSLLDEGTDTEEGTRIHDILLQPLRQSLELSLNDSDLSSILSYLKLLGEAGSPSSTKPSATIECSGEAAKDSLWNGIICPIFNEILIFLKDQVFKRCISSLSSSPKSPIESYSYSGTNIAITSNHCGTGFAFHQQLGILQKGVRIFLVFMKRAIYSELTTTFGCGTRPREDLKATVTALLEELCILMNPLGSKNFKATVSNDFDIGLDIRCNIGVGICYASCYLNYPDTMKIKSFFNQIFTPSISSEGNNIISEIENRILGISSSDVNKIALAFGILNTWLDQENHKDLYFAIGRNILDIQHGVKEAVNLGSSRVLEVWVDKLARCSIPVGILQHVSSLFSPLEFFCFMYMPGHIDAVKNCCRNIISILSRIYERLDEENIRRVLDDSKQDSWIASFLQTILEKPAHIKWIALSCVAKNTEKALIALELDSSLPEHLLTTPRTSRNAASDTYIALMSYHFKQGESRQAWEKTWIDPLFSCQLDKNEESNWSQKRNIISAILNSERMNLPKIKVMILPLLMNVVKKMNNDGKLAVEDDQSEASLLAAETIKIAFEHKITFDFKKLKRDSLSNSENQETMFRGLVPRAVLHNWLWSENAQIRLAGFSLLVETKKTTEEISKEDFDSLRLFFKYNLQSQQPAFRQQFISYFKKFVRRLKDSEGFARRKKNQNAVERYENFLQWLWNFLTEDEGLFPGANFGRRCQALECLSELTQTFTDFQSFGLDSSGYTKYLRWLIDTYENNKINALEVLIRMPIEEFEDVKFCNAVYQEAVSLCKSIKPPDSVTGRYLMTLLMQKCSKMKKDNNQYAPFMILESLYDELEQIHRSIESTSLIQVATTTPPYGTLRCIRMILHNTKDYKTDPMKYREYVAKLLKLCFTIDNILFPVLGSAAPEGFLPGLKDSTPEKNKQIVRSLTAQMLLVCAWRSMKENCLLMADMCTWFQMEGEDSPSSTASHQHLLSFQQVFDIGDHLLYLLKNLMHRGVFEQVFVGFKQLATRLWRSSSLKLNRLPEKWLQDAMDQEHISAKSITRRSAGLPFIFQALLSAECDNEPFLKKWIQRLLIDDETLEMAPTRIHSMNVLRGLFQDANFSSAMMPFVPHGLKMAFRGLKSYDWTERNSGLMLYGAVMRRSFGAKLNLMNAPTFFRKFPQMYDFLLDELDICIKLMEERNQEKQCFKMKLTKSEESAQPLTCDFTFHLLLLLSSFTESGRLEDTHFKLGAFIPRIVKCGESDDMEVRKLSAKALIPFLTSPEEKRDLMLKILSDLSIILKSIDSESISQNKLHGMLIQFLTIAKNLSVSSSEDHVSSSNYNNKASSSSSEEICTSFLTLLSYPSVVTRFIAPTIFETAMDILLSLDSLKCVGNDVIQRKGVYVLLKVYEKRFGDVVVPSQRNFVPGLLVADKAIANAAIHLIFDNSSKQDFMESVYQYFSDSTPKSRPYIEEFLALCQEENKILKRIFDKESEDKTFATTEIIVKNYLLEWVTVEFNKFPAMEMEAGYLKFIEQIPPHFLATLEKTVMTLLKQRMFELCDENGKPTTLQIRASAFRILGNIAFSTDETLTQVEETCICDIALKWSASDADDDMRRTVTESYPAIPFQQMGKFSGINQGKLWASIYLLAQDDESYNREIINRRLTITSGSHYYCDRKSLEVLISLYFQNYVEHFPVEGFLLVFGLLMRTDLEFDVKAAADDDSSEERIFDKSEMNMYFEHQTLVKIIVDEIDSFFQAHHLLNRNDIFDKILTCEQMSFYSDLSNTLTSSSDDDTEATTNESSRPTSNLTFKKIILQLQSNKDHLQLNGLPSAEDKDQTILLSLHGGCGDISLCKRLVLGKFQKFFET